MKRMLSLLLALVMALALLPAAQAADTASGTCGANLTWTLDSAGTLTVRGVGPMDDYTYQTLYFDPAPDILTTAPWMAYRSRVLRVTVASGVTSVGELAFNALPNLSQVTLADSVKTIGKAAFAGSAISEVTLPREMDFIGQEAFANCRNLHSVRMPDRLKDWGDCVFLDDEALETIAVPDGIAEIPAMAFCRARSLRAITIPVSVKKIDEHAFIEDAALKDIYYAGTEAQWRAITLVEDAPVAAQYRWFRNATVHYSSSAPAVEDPSASFTDVSGHWAEHEMRQSIRSGLMRGTASGVFSPEGSLTRAMVVTILWRMHGSPTARRAAAFSDLTDEWYLDAVAWAQENGIVKGVDETRFAPAAPITRQDLVTILYRALPEGDGRLRADLSVFPDAGTVSDYAVTPLRWAARAGIISGVPRNGATFLDPLATATRAQAAKIFNHYGSVLG